MLPTRSASAQNQLHLRQSQQTSRRRLFSFPAVRAPRLPALVDHRALFPMPSAFLAPRESTSPGIVRATPHDLAYVVHLQKRNHYSLGFLPRLALEEKIRLGRIHLALENDEPAGFLHHGSLAAPEVRIFQAAIQYDARRRHLGLGLVADLVARATEAGARGISLRCLSDLDANSFWRAAGFELIGTEPGARGTLNVWGRRLGASESIAASDVRRNASTACDPAHRTEKARASPSSFAFDTRLHLCPRCGRLTFDTWTRGAVRRRACPACVKEKRLDRSG